MIPTRNRGKVDEHYSGTESTEATFSWVDRHNVIHTPNGGREEALRGFPWKTTPTVPKP
jgi:hypothetical protein